MTLKFASLGSGSEGNGLLIQSLLPQPTTVLLDCGFGLRETEQRLQRLGVAPADLAGIIVTHEHGDHVGGVFKFARRHQLPVWLSFGTYSAVRADCANVQIHLCRDGAGFTIGALEFLPYTVPHDAREPLQFVISNGISRLGVLTDAGHATAHLVEALNGCDALVLECNHDVGLLANSVYPPSLKQRIGGAYGHLSNQVAAQILQSIDQSRLKTVVGAHLSQQNNSTELAHAALLAGLHSAANIIIACQQRGFDWVALGA